jgi:uncharacterized membrane protein
MAKRFLIYGAAGLLLEILWTSIGSAIRGDVRLVGRTYLWMFLIYGLAVAFEPVHRWIRHWPTPIRGLIWVALIFFLEYGAGAFIRLISGRCPWDYSGSPWNIGGLIRLDYAPAWFIAGLIFERFHDSLDRKG